MRFSTSLTLTLSLSLLAGGCLTEKKTPKLPAPKKKAPPPPEKKEPPKPATSDPACVGPWKIDGPKKTVKAGERTFEITGAKIVDTTKDEDAKAVIGVMANLKEDTAANLANIEALLAIFQKAKVEAIVVVGDLGESQDQIQNVMKPLADSGIPTFVVIGNREKRSDFNNALASFGDKPVFNMDHLRLVELDDVAFVSIPGYYDVGFIHAVEGCQYVQGDLDGTKEIVKAAGAKPVVLVSHGGPLQEGPAALDFTAEKANVGDPAMTKLIQETGVKLGLFANIHESGGQATDLSGKTAIPPKTPSDTLFLNPGAVDAVSWPMNDGTRSVGMASVLTIDGGKASYEVHRIKEKK